MVSGRTRLVDWGEGYFIWEGDVMACAIGGEEVFIEVDVQDVRRMTAAVAPTMVEGWDGGGSISPFRGGRKLQSENW